MAQPENRRMIVFLASCAVLAGVAAVPHWVRRATGPE